MKQITMEEMLDAVIGAQLISLGDCGFTVRTIDNQYISFEFEEDDDYTTYNEITTRLYFDPNDKKNAPIITNAIYNNEADAYDDYACITFLGLNKVLAYANFHSAGDEYYACSVTLNCPSACKYAIVTSIF